MFSTVKIFGVDCTSAERVSHPSVNKPSVPVSYTHLDVYKRQEYIFILIFRNFKHFICIYINWTCTVTAKNSEKFSHYGCVGNFIKL